MFIRFVIYRGACGGTFGECICQKYFKGEYCEIPIPHSGAMHTFSYYYIHTIVVMILPIIYYYI